MSKLRIKRLFTKNIPGAGLQIFAETDKGVNFVEYKTTPAELCVLQPASQTVCGYEPWRQFPPKEYDEMLAALFDQLCKAWNAIYAPTNKNNTA